MADRLLSIGKYCGGQVGQNARPSQCGSRTHFVLSRNVQAPLRVELIFRGDRWSTRSLSRRLTNGLTTRMSNAQSPGKEQRGVSNV
jgi:hypothetical protein